MYERIKRLRERCHLDTYPICIEKFKITLDVLDQYKNESVILKRARMMEAYVDRMPIAIQEDELLVGIGASKPMGLEIDPSYGIWTQDEIDSLKEDGFTIDPADEKELQELNERFDPVTLIGEEGKVLYEVPRFTALFPSGVVLPPWKPVKGKNGVGGGYAQTGLGVGPSLTLEADDISLPIRYGTDELVRRCEEAKANLHFTDIDSLERFRGYEAMIIALKALGHLGERYAELAFEMAKKEDRPERKAELLEIAEICRHVPRQPARNFREAMQAFWFVFLMHCPCSTIAAGRFDQYMYPYYKADIDAGAITDEEVIELLCCLRMKDMEINRTSGKMMRQSQSGLAKWHNFIIGGQKKDGSDASNELSYLLLEAARIAQVPHHTITLRVFEGTPESLIMKGIELAKTGIGMPAFISDKSYIKTLEDAGVSIEDAREYVVSGCLDLNVPGKSRTGTCPMIIMPKIFDIMRANGVDTKTGNLCTLETGEFAEFKTWEDFHDAWHKQLEYIVAVSSERSNLELNLYRELLPDPLRSALMEQGIESGRMVFDNRNLVYDNGGIIVPVGAVNVGDSFTAVKKLIFDEKKYTMAQLKDALDNNWEGYEQMRQDFLKAPKYGNNIPEADRMVADVYKELADLIHAQNTIYGVPNRGSAISITSHQPGGAMTGATPDGRKAGEILADGSMSPMHGVDTEGPLAILNSAMNVDQDAYQATLLNMKFDPSTVATEEACKKLAAMIRVYLTNGGKHVQFNIVNTDVLKDAYEFPNKHRDLIVRIAGFSTYFVQLSRVMQQEVIDRNEQKL